jgi:outer membrane protein TolC
MMKNKLILLFALGLCTQVQAQAPHLSREAYRDRVEAYSQVLKQQHLKSMASTDARKIAFTGFLPKVDISAEGTLNLKEMDSWDGPAGITLIKGYSSCRSHSIQAVPCKPRTV